MSEVSVAEMTPEERKLATDELRQQLELMGLKPHHNAKYETLKELLDENIKPKTKEITSTQSSRVALRKACIKMVRIRLQCMNPAKAQFKGEYFTSGNDVVGTIRDFVPYNCEEAEDMLVPRILVNCIKERMYTRATDKPKNRGFVEGVQQNVQLVPEFVVAELD